MPSKTPRDYEIFHTLHAMQRQTLRDISTLYLEDTIRNGTDRPLVGKGSRGGSRRRFEKLILDRRIVVIAEVQNKKCYVITAYEDPSDL